MRFSQSWMQAGFSRPDVLEKLAAMAKNDPSQVVRLYLASAVQRLPFAQRWSILQGLVSHAEDVSDNNLPRMYWFCVGADGTGVST